MAEPWPAVSLTAMLLAPPCPAVIEERSAVMDMAKRIPRALADLAVPRLGRSTLRVTDHHVRIALAAEIPSITDTPFAWSPRTARRTLGLAAVRSMVAGEARSPIDGVRRAIADAIRSVREGERSAASVDRWLAGLAPAGLAVAEADAVTWATRLWCALDWNAFDELPSIGRDHWWNSPHSSLLAIRRSRRGARRHPRSPWQRLFDPPRRAGWPTTCQRQIRVERGGAGGSTPSPTFSSARTRHGLVAGLGSPDQGRH